MQTPVVFLPGLLEPALIWRPAIAALGLSCAQHLVVDLPGHRPGDTPAGTRHDLRSGVWLDHLARRIATRFYGRPALFVGHSTGGMLAMAFARRHPGLVESLCVVNAPIRLPDTSALRFGRHLLLGNGIGTAAFMALWHLWLSSPEHLARGFRMGTGSTAPLPDAHAIRQHLLRCDPMAVRETARWVARTDVTDALAHIKAPVLALVARGDPVVPPRHQFDILKGVPNAHARLIEGGHLLFADAPQELARAIAAWRALAPSRAPAGLAPALAGE